MMGVVGVGGMESATSSISAVVFSSWALVKARLLIGQLGHMYEHRPAAEHHHAEPLSFEQLETIFRLDVADVSFISFTCFMVENPL